MQCTGGVLNETSILFNSFHLRSTHGISCTNSIRTIIYVTPFLSLYKKWIQKRKRTWIVLKNGIICFEVLAHWPDLPSRWMSTWYQAPSFTLFCVAFTLMVPEPMSSSRYKLPSRSSTAKKSTFVFFWLRASFLSCCFPWVKRISPFGSVVRKSKEMEPTRLVFHLGRLM